MESLDVVYQDWKAPTQDGEVLLWPGTGQFFTDIKDNARHLQGAHATLLQGVPLPEVRRAARQWSGLDDSRPVIATGHQTELYHAGVWAKEALIAATAAKAGGQAVHVAVDTDSPKHLSIRWPGASFPITDDGRILDANWSGLLAAPTPAQTRLISSALNDAAGAWSFEPVAGVFLETLLGLAPHDPDLSGAISQAIRQLDRSLGIDNNWLLVSPMVCSESYLLFAYHLLARAPDFAAHYNRALAVYRIDHKIRSVTRPMPDLAVGEDRCEMPFWLDNLANGERERAAVQRQGGQWVLRISADVEFTFDPAANGWESARNLQTFLRGNQLRLSPRALTLTLFLRLCLADQFVHGIGGGRYDQVTDAIIDSYFALTPPRFSVTTATLFFPDAAHHQRACLPCVAHQGHQLKHRIMGQEKMSLVSRISQLPRNSADRQIAFGRMHGRMAAMQLDHPAIREWEERFREAKVQSSQEQLLFDRELFYGIQSRPRLMQIIRHYDKLLSAC